MTTLAFAVARDDGAALMRPGVAAIRLNGSLWRVTRPEGEVLGYVESFPTREGTRYRVKRLVPRSTRFIGMGEFWNLGDAVDIFSA